MRREEATFLHCVVVTASGQLLQRQMLGIEYIAVRNCAYFEWYQMINFSKFLGGTTVLSAYFLGIVYYHAKDLEPQDPTVLRTSSCILKIFSANNISVTSVGEARTEGKILGNYPGGKLAVSFNSSGTGQIAFKSQPVALPLSQQKLSTAQIISQQLSAACFTDVAVNE